MSKLTEVVSGKEPVQEIQTLQTLQVDHELLAMQKEALRLELEAKRLEVQQREMEIKEKSLNLQDLQERLDERQLRRETKEQRSRTNGETLRQIAVADASAQKRCNHRKGGKGEAGVIAGQGDSPNYAIIKHTFANGDTWARCTRCGKTWKPPVRRAATSQEQYDALMAQYELAMQYPTTNIPSSSYLFKYSDNGEYYREVTANSTLR